MKANRKFRSGDDAVSPVIAVILMVAITVVLAATVYVWVSGFGTNSSQPAKSLAMTSAGAITAVDVENTNTKNYTISAASPGLKWTDLTFKLNGADMSYNAASINDASTGDTDDWCVMETLTTCYATATAAGVVTAGQKFRIEDPSLSGQEFLVLDSAANSIILTLTVS